MTGHNEGCQKGAAAWKCQEQVKEEWGRGHRVAARCSKVQLMQGPGLSIDAADGVVRHYQKEITLYALFTISPNL